MVQLLPPVTCCTVNGKGPDAPLADPFSARAGRAVKRDQSAAAARRTEGMGELQVTVDTSAIPPLREIDPERCYVAWDMVLATTAEPEAIRDVFIFVEQECELTIELDGAERPSEAAPGAAATAVARTSGGNGGSEPAGLDRKARPAGQPGGRTGDGAGASERGCGAPGRSRHPGHFRRDRPAGGRSARYFDADPHAAAADDLRTFPPAGSRPGKRTA